MSRRMTASRVSPVPLIVPALAVVILFMLLPLLFLARLSLNRFSPTDFMIDALSIENYVRFFTDPFYLSTLRTTVGISAAVTAICLVLGYPLARLIVRSGARSKQWLIMALFLPLFVGNAVRAAGWMMVLGRDGLLNVLAGAVPFAGGPWQLIYTPGAVVVGIAAVNLPFVTLTIQSVLEGIDGAVEEAAASLGAAAFPVFRLVTLPLAMPGIAAGAVLCFILAMNAYATPVLLGGPGFRMMAPVVADEILQKSNVPFGATLAFVLMAATLLLTTVMTLWLGRRGSRA